MKLETFERVRETKGAGVCFAEAKPHICPKRGGGWPAGVSFRKLNQKFDLVIWLEAGKLV